MAKKYFIRVQHEDLVREQNKLLMALLKRQENKPPAYLAPHQFGQSQPESFEETEEFNFDYGDDTPFVPTIEELSSSLLPSVEATKVDFDMEGVEKLKKVKSKTRRV